MVQTKKRSGSKRYYWMRLKTDFFDQPEIKKLRRLAGGDTYTIIYLKMMLKTVDNNGMFVFQGLEDTFEKEVALIIDEDENNVMMTITYLRNHNLLEEGFSDNGYVLNAVPELIGSETADAKRKRIARSMDSEEHNFIESNNGSDNVRQLSADVRICPTDIELEQEQEKEEEIDKEIVQSTVQNDISSNLSSQKIVMPDTYSSTEELQDFVSRNLTDDQYQAFKQLFNLMIKGELQTTKIKLYQYFDLLMRREWKDSNGEPIRDIVRYVQRNFALNSKASGRSQTMN